MTSCEGAASLLLLELCLVRVLVLDLVCAFFVFTLRVFFCGLSRRQQRRPAAWWRQRVPQVRGRVSRMASLLLDVDLTRMLLLDQGSARMVLH